MLDARTIRQAIARPAREVYDFAADPRNLHLWASGLGEALSPSPDGWIAQTPDGPARIRFVEANELGVLDHWVITAQGQEVYVPMRVIANGDGAEVLFTLFRQPDMTDETLARDEAWVTGDLEALRRLLEG
jgi:hypothetical protein